MISSIKLSGAGLVAFVLAAVALSPTVFAVTGQNAEVDDVDPMLFPHVGTIMVKPVGSSQYVSVCTGTLIDTDSDFSMVVSAGHCVAITEVFMGAGMFEEELRFSLDPHPESNEDAVLVPIKYQVAHPEVAIHFSFSSGHIFANSQGNSKDVAIYVLNEDIDDNVPVAELPEMNSVNNRDFVRQPAFVVGYTSSENTLIPGEGIVFGETESQRRYGVVPIGHVSSNQVYVRPGAARLGINVCGGDSGGPIFRETREDVPDSIVLGVLSGHATSQATDICNGTGANYMRLDVAENRDFLDTVIDTVENDGYPCLLGYANHVLHAHELCELNVPPLP